MALRVLLADESPTIKKVMQISLQDFDVELKTVQLGIDVIQVAEFYQPEIIFCDVLLQKKSGYEVSQELKGNAKTSHIPIVLMWSSFMELDEAKFKECGANGQIEKPFDANTLRDIVKRLVKSTQSQNMSDFLEFPEVTSLAASMPPLPKETVPPPAPQLPPSDASWSMDSFEDIAQFNPKSLDEPVRLGPDDTDVDRFSQKPLQALRPPERPVPTPTAPPKPVITKIAPLTPDFAQKNQADRGRGPQGMTREETIMVDLPQDDEVSQSELLSNVSMHPSDLDKFNIKSPPRVHSEESAIKTRETTRPNIRLQGDELNLTIEQIETIVRSQSKEIIEKIVWKLVPEIADKLIKDEIHRLMDETKL